MKRSELFLLGVGGLFLALLQFRPIDDAHLFTQLRLGQMELQTGSIISSEPFVFTQLGEKYSNVDWLAQMVFAQVYEWGGFLGLRFFNAFLIAAAFFLAGKTGLRMLQEKNEGCSLFACGLSFVLPFLAALSNTSVRPQSIALICLAASLYQAFSTRSFLYRLFYVSALGIIWQNSHPSLGFGAAVLGLYALTSCISTKSFSKGAELFVLSLWMGILQFATPLGQEIFNVSRDNFFVSRTLLGVSEWLPAWENSRAMLGFWLLCSVVAAAVLRIGATLKVQEFVFLVLCIGLSLSASRFVLFTSIVILPHLFSLFERARPQHIFSWSGDIPVTKGAIACLSFLSILSVVICVSFSKKHLLDPEIPVETIQKLSQSYKEARIFNYREWGGPLEFFGSPEWKVFIDGRLYQFSAEYWKEYNRAAEGSMSLEEIEKRYKPDVFFLHPTFDENLIKLLKTSSRWRVIAQEPQAIAFDCSS